MNTMFTGTRCSNVTVSPGWSVAGFSTATARDGATPRMIARTIAIETARRFIGYISSRVPITKS
jgi:hypothetical protein